MTSMGGKDFLELESRIVLLTAAIGHDVAHPGLTNKFLLESNHPFALDFEQGSAVLEQMHASTTLHLLERHKLFSFASEEKEKSMKHLLVQCILNTDMNVHMKLLSAAQSLIHARENQLALPLPKDDEEMFASFLLHCADISNAAKPWTTAFKWSQLVMQFVS